MSIYDRIKQKRLENNMTLEDVAKIMGTSRQTIQKYENGKVINIPYEKIEMLAKALKTTPAYLMGWEDESGTTSNEAKNTSDAIQGILEQRPELKELYEAAKNASAEDIKRALKIIEALSEERK